LAAQALEQLPQWPGSVKIFTHWVPHLIVPDGQLQLPLVQTWPPLQATPQDPQSVLLAVRSTHEPPQFVRLPAPPSAAVAQPPVQAP